MLKHMLNIDQNNYKLLLFASNTSKVIKLHSQGASQKLTVINKLKLN